MNPSQHQKVLQELDRLISDLSTLRIQLTRLDSSPSPRSIRQAEYFGIWTDREDLPTDRSSREWLTQWRQQQWQRS